MKNNQSGFGLLETLISVAVISVITYGVMNQAELVGRVKGKAEFSEQVTTITNSIKMALGNTQTCTDFVSDVPIGTFQELVRIGGNSSTTSLYVPGAGLAYGGEIINRNLSLPHVGATPDVPSSGSQPQLPPPILSWDPATSNYKNIEGLEVKKIQLVSDGYRLILRFTFEKPSILSAINLGGSVVTKDIFIRGNKYPGIAKLMDCESDFKVSVKDFCLNANGTSWESGASEKCIYPATLKKSPPVITTRPIYIINGKLVSDKLVISSTASCSCPSSNCLCTCSPTCPAGNVAEIPPRFVVNDSRLLFAPSLITGPQRCGYVRDCYTKQVIPAGLRPVGNLIR
jgi:type II secretory pathway pseudopilin PulG